MMSRWSDRDSEHMTVEHTTNKSPPPPASNQQMQGYQYYYPPPSGPPKDYKPTAAGILLLIVFLLGLIMGLAMVIFAEEIVNELILEVDDGEISGKIVYAGNSTPAVNVLVRLEPEDVTTRTRTNGGYEFNDLKAGKYTVVVSQPGYKTVKMDIFITEAGQVEEADFELEEGSGEVMAEPSELGFIWTTSLFLSCGVIMLVFSMIALVGAVYSIKRENYWLTLAAALLGVFTLLGTIFSIIALILLLLSKKAFE